MSKEVTGEPRVLDNENRPVQVESCRAGSPELAKGAFAVHVEDVDSGLAEWIVGNSKSDGYRSYPDMFVVSEEDVEDKVIAVLGANSFSGTKTVYECISSGADEVRVYDPNLRFSPEEKKLLKEVMPKLTICDSEEEATQGATLVIPHMSLKRDEIDRQETRCFASRESINPDRSWKGEVTLLGNDLKKKLLNLAKRDSVGEQTAKLGVPETSRDLLAHR